ncbi:2-hydroxy-3-oxopropionate reductase [Claveliimonas bilis]|uniref:NAD(P)-dependent oxidoreductase n=1 Tax=Claveliimonas bilis TaxID=3028070 RepID=UPI001E5544D5|nr:NAD(P)-dependent oxidoreductase [Claveliimonas bilis]BCZ27829.1 2-hydroxy-3-oxopropionate reductase [Claveliimonas bilis]BDZ83417.1 2-hydroxy-3-oxopropionate reductase [Claveliimonas bilis]
MRKYDKVGLIGLGVMGYGMALNLIKAGYTLVACDVNKERIKMIPDQDKVIAVDHPCEVLEHTNTVITMLPNSPHVLEVLEGEQGLLSGEIPEDLFVIDMSSISPDVTKEIGKKLEEKGVKFLDGPVSGGQSGAMNGALTIMVGGKAEDLEDAMPLFQAVGKNIIHCGECGAGQVVKVVNQLMSAINLISMSEAFTLGTKAGVDPEIMMNVIKGGSGRCWAVEDRMPQILKGNFDPGFTINLHTKDIKLAVDMAKNMNLPLYATNLVAELFKTAQVKGYGMNDNCAIIKLYEELAGVEVRK